MRTTNDPEYHKKLEAIRAEFNVIIDKMQLEYIREWVEKCADG